MADLKTILGDTYKDGMTIEEINTALAEREFFDKSELSKYVPKAIADKYASEAADFKKKYNSKLSEEEQKEAQRKAEQDELNEKYGKLLKESTISKNKAKFLGLGYDEALATETAEALTNGDMDKVFENQSKFLVLKEQSIKTELLKKTPTPPAWTGSDKETSKEDFAKMTYAEREKLLTENKELYEKLTGGNE